MILSHLFFWLLFCAVCIIALSEVVVAVYAVIKGERDVYMQLRR